MKDLKFVIFAIVALAVAWFALGGPSRSNTTTPFIGGVSGNEKISGTRTYEDRKDISDELDKVEADLNEIEKELEKARSKTEASIYQGEIEIYSYTKAKNTSPDNEYIRLRVSKKARDRINITGWRLVSPVSGKSIEIGKGVYLPYSAQVNPEEQILVEPGQEIYLLTGRSPIGISFRINKCTGYFEQFQNFEPRLPIQCPKPIDELYDLVEIGGGISSDQCIDFVEDLDRCEIQINSVPARLSGACQSFITEKLNYNTCVSIHKNDKDFKGNEWRIYFSNDYELWRKSREIIKLLDSGGKTVDVITY